jgi:hypothetical protein
MEQQWSLSGGSSTVSIASEGLKGDDGGFNKRNGDLRGGRYGVFEGRLFSWMQGFPAPAGFRR